MALLTFGDWIGLLGDGVDEWHVVGVDIKVYRFEKMPEVTDGSMES